MDAWVEEFGGKWWIVRGDGASIGPFTWEQEARDALDGLDSYTSEPLDMGRYS